MDEQRVAPVAGEDEAASSGPPPAMPLPPPFAEPPPPPQAAARPAAPAWSRPATQASSSGEPQSETVRSEGRSCSECGAHNPFGSAFCWACYHRFPQPGMPGGGAAGPSWVNGPVPYDTPIGSPIRPAPDASPPPRTKALKGSAGKVLVALVAVAVAFFGGRVVWEGMNRTRLQVPPAIAGMQLIDDPRLQGEVQQLETIASDRGITGKAGFYGLSGVPQFFFYAAPYHADPSETPDLLFDEFAGRLVNGGQSHIDMRSKSTDVASEATFVCARVRGAQPGSICLWFDQDVVGVVGSPQKNVQGTHDLTAQVRSAVES